VGIVDDEPVALFATANRTMYVKNPDARRALTVARVSTSCGCIEASAGEFSVQPGQSKSIPVRIDATDIGVDPAADVYIETSEFGVLTYPVRVGVIPVVDGWPNYAVGRRSGDELTIAMASCYASNVVSATVYVNGSDIGVAGKRDEHPSRFVLDLSGLSGEQFEVALDTPGGRWCRPLRLQAPALRTIGSLQ